MPSSVPPTGPSPCRIAMVATDPGDSETQHFLDAGGRELRKMLAQLGASLDDIFYTYIFDHPVEELPDVRHLVLPPAQLDRLSAELVACQPNVIVALGDVPVWALLRRYGLKSVRGAVHTSLLAGTEGRKVLATYAPATIIRQYSLRAIALGDLEKALAESTTPELRHEFAEVWTEPTLGDLRAFELQHLIGARILSADVETRRGQITCVGLAPSRHCAIVVPFWRGTSPVSYWPDTRSEVLARQWVARYLEDAEVVKVHQNGLYDIQYYIAEGVKPRACTEDTMLAHHSLWSELPKNLEYLGSTFTDFRSWKGIHRTRAEDQLKRDD